MRARGEPVRLNYGSTNGSSGSAVLQVYDANSIIRPIAADERLIILDLTASAQGPTLNCTILPISTNPISMITFSGYNTTAAAAGPWDSWHTPGEGLSGLKGTNPWVNNVAGTAAVITGNGYIQYEGGFTKIPPFVQSPS